MADTETTKKKRHRGRKGLIALIVIVVILGGGFLWLVWPDLPPHPMQALADSISSKFAKEKPLPQLDASQQQQLIAEIKKNNLDILTPVPGSVEEREAGILSQLQAAHLPVTSVSILENGAGEKVLTLGVDYQKLAGGKSSSAGLSEGLDTLIKALNDKSLSLNGIADVTLFVQDADGRVLFGASAPTDTINRYRAGNATQRDLVRSIGFKAVSRLGVIDALKKLVSK